MTGETTMTLFGDHREPAWCDRGDGTITAKTRTGLPGVPPREERLWARKLTDGRFEVCCIPFFAYDVALGDEVEVELDSQGRYMLRRIAKRSGHSTLRVKLSDRAHAAPQPEVSETLLGFGCLLEWYSEDLVAIDVAPDVPSGATFSFLLKEESLGRLQFEISRNSKTGQFKVHLNPVWHDRANSLVNIAVSRKNSLTDWEQVWARKLTHERFEICCIPFFAYDLSLGDEVETTHEYEMMVGHVVKRVIKPSGHRTFRVLFGRMSCDHSREDVFEQVFAEVSRLGGLFEWYSLNLLAIDVHNDQAQPMADFLLHHEELGHFVYETGAMR